MEDLDTLVRIDETWTERYYQIKSRQESAGRWTLNLLDREGVLTTFLSLFRKFRLLGFHQKRAIQLVVVVDGELDGELARARDEGVKAAEIKAKLFALLCARDVVYRNHSLEPIATAIRDFYQSKAQLILAGDIIAASKSGELGSPFAKLTQSCGEPADVIERRLIEVAEDIAPLLDEFVASLRFDSRLGPLLSEATFARLMEAGDLSPDEAWTAFDRLKRSVQEESAQAMPAVIDHLILREWLGVPKRLRLQAKPMQDVNVVARNELLGEVADTLRTERFVLLHGLSKIGKSQFVAALIDYDHKEENYFWYTFLGDAGDLDRLTKQLAVWVGEKTGKWQIMDDLEKTGLSPFQAFERLRHSAISGSYIVLDDCHKAIDTVVFEMLHKVTSEYWSGSRLILVSERKLPSAVASGAREIPIGGLSPQESLLFLNKLGVDLIDSKLQFFMLAVQVGGHPVMLKAAAEELPPRPSLADVLALGERMPSIASAQAFLSDLSNRIFFDLLKTQDQRTWLSRIAVVTFPVTPGLAISLAEMQPRLQVVAADWNYLKSLLLDESSADHYSVPVLLRRIAGESISLVERKALQVRAARYVFKTAIASRSIDFWDFQNALVALLAAGHYDEAAIRFVYSFGSLMRLNSFEPLELLFLAMNNETTHAKITDPSSCWLMLMLEIQLRVQSENTPNQQVLCTLIRRLHARLNKSAAVPGFARPMTHIAIAAVRMRTQKDSPVLTATGRRRIFVPLYAALRGALAWGDVGFLANVLGFYEHLYPMVTKPNVELLKDALLQLPSKEPLPMSVHALIGIYARFVSGSAHSETSLQVVESHGALFHAIGRNDAYFACEHAVATILHDGQANYSQARERIESIMSRAIELQLSTHSLDHGSEFIAGTYWAERNYSKSAEYYQLVVHADLGTDGMHQITCERLCDSLIFLGKHKDAARIALSELRLRESRGSPEYRAQMYARLAYAYAEHGELRKAAISCLGLSRVANLSGSDALDFIAATLAGWVLGHFSYSDPLIPQSSTTNIRDSNALSDTIPPEEVNRWRDSDPFSSPWRKRLY